jgi:hypothetical protein
MSDVIVVEAPLPADTVEVSSGDSVTLEVVGGDAAQVVVVQDTIVIEVATGSADIIEVLGEAGPAGPGGSEDMPYAKRNDVVGNLIYRAEAAPGSLDSAPVWRIWVITMDGDDSMDQWAGGNANFDKVWNDHLTLEYV